MATTQLNKYEKWLENHDCNLNHVGSAGKMEITVATHIFSRSIRKRKLQYSKYLGD